MYLVEWFSVAHRKEVYEVVQKGTFDIFFGIGHRMRKEEMKEQFKKKKKKLGWSLATDAARLTDRKAGREDCKHKSGGFFVARNNDLRAVMDKELGAVRSFPGNEGRIAQARVNVRGGMRVFAAHIWHSEGWTSRSVAMMEAGARTTRHPWLVACGANMDSRDFKNSLWFRRKCMSIEAPEE